MPWPQHYLSLNVQGKLVDMAYMDVSPAKPNGQTMLLLHGKNFNGWYWKGVMNWALERGYRVIVPDQLGFGNSDYPDIHYSFHLLAANTRQILSQLGIEKVIVVGHSMGGMLATRFTLMYPQLVDKLILEDPIGLEDYRTFVPYTTIEDQYKKELSATYESYLDYQKTYFPQWKPDYDSQVIVQAAALAQPDFKTDIARANALTYDMIYQQPVCYEFSHITVPTLLIIGSEDRTVVGKALLSDGDKKRYGQYPQLARKTVAAIPHAQLRELPGVGHIPHIQEPALFFNSVGTFLQGR
jgi:pimeloyl-ACP methyl ester carboxylesterase